MQKTLTATPEACFSIHKIYLTTRIGLLTSECDRYIGYWVARVNCNCMPCPVLRHG